jgi:hypothetical protein
MEVKGENLNSFYSKILPLRKILEAVHIERTVEDPISVTLNLALNQVQGLRFQGLVSY